MADDNALVLHVAHEIRGPQRGVVGVVVGQFDQLSQAAPFAAAAVWGQAVGPGRRSSDRSRLRPASAARLARHAARRRRPCGRSGPGARPAGRWPDGTAPPCRPDGRSSASPRGPSARRRSRSADCRLPRWPLIPRCRSSKISCPTTALRRAKAPIAEAGAWATRAAILSAAQASVASLGVSPSAARGAATTST